MASDSAANIQVVPPAQLDRQDAQQKQAMAAAQQNAMSLDSTQTSGLAGFVRSQYEIMRNHRNTVSGWNERLLVALRTFMGQYDGTRKAEINKFGGSDVFARIVAAKCRGASSLLRDVYLGPDRPYCIKPPPAPDLDPQIIQQIEQVVQHERQILAGQPNEPSEGDYNDRLRDLYDQAEEAAVKRATDQAKIAEDKVEKILQEGGFYKALAEIIVDLPIYPLVCLKGPVVKITQRVVWVNGKPVVKQVPHLYWYRVNPFDIWFTPGVSDIEDACIIEKQQTTRAKLNDMLQLPGFDQNAILNVLDHYGRGGLYDNWDSTDAERAVLESRENPMWNRSGLISMMQFTGNVQGRLLADYGLPVQDEMSDYHVEIWMVGQYIIKAQLTPSPRQRHDYFITSYEKVPGTPVGNSLVDVLADIQEVANATLRGLVNNMSISSGPQVLVNDDRLSPDEDGESLYPWKRWHFRADPSGNNNQPPISFFAPPNNSQALLEVYKELNNMADDLSAIPRYIGGSQGGGGAGRTASGLAMLMGNSSKLLQNVAANMDRDIIEPNVLHTVELMMMTDPTGIFTGEEKVEVQGVTTAMQRETERQRQLEFLAHTQNPVDQQIVGLAGRGKVLRAVANTIGLDGEGIVPSDQQLQNMQQQNQQPPPPPTEKAIQDGITAGVEQGAQQIVAEVIKANLPQQISQAAIQANTNLPSHPAGGQAMAPNPPSGSQAPGGDMAAASAQGQGNQAPDIHQQGGPQTNLQPAQPATPAGPAIGPH